MDDITICAHCGNTDMTQTDMILVEPTPNEEDNLWFCTWNCVGDYAISEATRDVE